MGLLDYQRTILGYHGTDQQTAERVMAGELELGRSRNRYDWLGHGIYFWEHGPQRAIEWADERAKPFAGELNRPAVIGAVIHLGNCFVLLDTWYTNTLASLFPLFRQAMIDAGVPMPENKPSAKSASPDRLLRLLDCAMINWTLDRIKGSEGIEFQRVRCVFSEEIEAFPGSCIKAKSHIQVAVRDPRCILGYFRPVLDRRGGGGLIAVSL